jgi:hypothetical protein
MKQCFLAICASLALLTVSPGFAQGQTGGDYPWRKSGKDTWKKEIEGMTLRLARLGKLTYFAVTVPCGTSDGKMQTYRWTSGESVGKTDNTPCNGFSPTTKADLWLEFFLPLPADYNPRATDPVEEKLRV